VSLIESHHGNDQPLEGEPEKVSPTNRFGRNGNQDGVRHTRIGRAWVAVGVAAVLGVALVDFIVQNTRSVRIEFFSVSGQIPVAVALLGAALVGAFIVLTVGIARTTQLRIATRRGKKREKRAESLATGT
jgi:lipopolysaccharide assembly protein A